MCVCVKGLVINLLHHYWPELLRVPGFLVEFITPIVTVRKGKARQNFYTIPEYELWKESNNVGVRVCIVVCQCVCVCVCVCACVCVHA
jgi:hypothetical protein